MSAMLDRERCQDDMICSAQVEVVPFVHIHTEVGLVLKAGDSLLFGEPIVPLYLLIKPLG